MNELHWTEVDGVKVVWAEAPGALRGGLLFRAGRVDETLATSGYTHLVEHMAFSSVLDDLHRHNGMVDIATTGFFTVGNPGDVARFLADICDRLTDLPAARLDDEKRVLKAEAATRSHDLLGHLLVWRFGAADYGMAGMAELGLHCAAIDPLRAFGKARFTRGNAILWLTGPPPDGLRLRLPPGERRPLPALAPMQAELPGCFADNLCGGAAAGAIVPRSSASTLFAEVALQRLRKRLRVELSLSYAPAVFYVPLDGEFAHLVLYADADEPRRLDLTRAFGEIVPRLAEVKDAEVEEARARIREHWSGALAPPMEERVAGELYRTASNWLYGRALESREALEAELAACTTEEVAVVGREAHSTAIYALPGNAPLEPWCGKMIPVSTMSVVKGREVLHWDAPVQKERLRYGSDGVSLVAPDGSHCSVHFQHLALALQREDGCITLIGQDAATLAIEPTLWRRGREICRWIGQCVPAHLLVTLPAREAAEIPMPRTTAWKRFLARLDPTPVADPADAGDPMRILYRWCLMLYGYWKISAAIRSGVAATHALPASDQQLFSAGSAALSALSVLIIILLAAGWRRALVLFAGIELATCFWLLSFGHTSTWFIPLIAIAVMTAVSTQAKFQAGW